jgi:hypothetical protein
MVWQRVKLRRASNEGYRRHSRRFWVPAFHSGFSTTMPFGHIVALMTFAGMLASKEEKRIPCVLSSLAWEQFEKVIKLSMLNFRG